MIDAALVLAHTTMPAIVFDAPLAADAPNGAAASDLLDLRAHDLPVSDVSLRNDVRQRWRTHKRLTVRIDEAPTPQITALLLELARREVRLDAGAVDRFDETHTLVVKTTSRTPPASLVRFFPIRVRFTASSPSAVTPAKGGRDAGRR